MTKIDIDKLLHQRIIDECKSLYEDGHFPQAALESMKQVELALKEKAEIGENLFGKRLVDQLFGSGKSIKLKIPLGDELQEQAKLLFKGAFSYYRNYAAHDGSKIDETICIRVMVLASELLDLIGASSISFTEIGGVKGLIEKGIFDDESQIADLLSFLSPQVFPYETFDGMFEDLAERGYSDQQYQAVFDLDLVEYHSEMRNHGFPGEPADWDTFGWLELTTQGRKVRAQIRKSS
ncbi:MAG: TIGR02391 family protein [Candidatus Thorarchaeota archaeon]|nr:TIGR02391 family protein [Candidatus Thorarchaeota archaeon]